MGSVGFVRMQGGINILFCVGFMGRLNEEVGTEGSGGRRDVRGDVTCGFSFWVFNLSHFGWESWASQ